jgi:hypothetical protein
MGIFCLALTNCEDMNSVNQEYLDRGESIYIARVDSVSSIVGLNKIWFKWWLKGDPRIAKTEIRWVEGITTKSKEYAIDLSQSGSPVMEAVMDEMPEGSFSFEFINWDSEGNRSVSLSASAEIPGDRYRATFNNRPIDIATKFGNGYALVWGVSDCDYSIVSYKTVGGSEVTLRLPADSADVTPRMLLYDFDGVSLTQTTYYTLKSAVFSDEIVAPAEVYTDFNDVSATLTSSTTAIARPGDFDLGGEGIGFHDSNTGHDPGSGGANYRPNLGDFGSAAMDIEGDGGNIGYSNAGEWVQYTVNVEEADYYAIDWYISVNRSSGSACHIEVDGSVVGGSFPLVNNGQWSDWRYYCEVNGIIPPYLHLTQGKHTVRFVWDETGFNFNGLRIRRIDPNNPTIIYPCIRSGWTAESLGGNHDWGEYLGTPVAVLDGNKNTGWHSNLNTPMPQCLVVDMKASKLLSHIVLYHLPNGLVNNWIYFKTIEVYLSDTPVTPNVYQSSWGAPAVRYDYPGGIDGFRIDFAPNSRGQYMILYFPNSTTNNYISFTELEVYGIAE